MQLVGPAAPLPPGGVRSARDQVLFYEQPYRPGHRLGAYALIGGEIAGGHGAVAVECTEHGDLAQRDAVLVFDASGELAHSSSPPAWTAPHQARCGPGRQGPFLARHPRALAQARYPGGDPRSGGPTGPPETPRQPWWQATRVRSRSLQAAQHVSDAAMSRTETSTVLSASPWERYRPFGSIRVSGGNIRRGHHWL